MKGVSRKVDLISSTIQTFKLKFARTLVIMVFLQHRVTLLESWTSLLVRVLYVYIQFIKHTWRSDKKAKGRRS